jgi:predicted phosphodiesterase
LLREAALKALASSDLIIHAGDIGKLEVLDALRTLAPVVAVRGNIDTEPWALALPRWRSNRDSRLRW